MGKEYTFKDLIKHSVISIPEEAGVFSSGEYTIYGVGTHYNNEPYIELLYEDPYGERDSYLEILSETEFYEGDCIIVSIPDEETQRVITELDNLIISLNSQAKEIVSKSKEAGLDYDVVVLSDVGDLVEWHSSRC